MNKTKLRTLVVGGSGYIGSSLVPALISSGRDVVVLDYVKNISFDFIGVEYISGDFSDKELLNRITIGCDEIVHLAYATVPNTSFDNPCQDLNKNVASTLQLFSIAAKKKIKVIYISSGGAVYGQSNILPIPEDQPTKPISPYGITKLTLENYAYFYSVNFGLNYICLRPANPYGVGQKPFCGQGFVSTAIASILQQKPVMVYGVGGSVRDYIYISDLVNAILCAMDKGRIGETYNIGTGVGHSNFDILKKLEHLMFNGTLKVRCENLPKRTFDVESNILDFSRLNKHTGWKPSVDIDDGLTRSIDWIKSFLVLPK